MTESECLEKMIAPGTHRPGKWRGGVIQIWLTRACNLNCIGCTQSSQLSGNPGMMTVEQFEIAVKSLKGYFGVVGVFGGNPAMNPHFEAICEVMREHVPFEQRGLWCNNPLGKGKVMRGTFNDEGERWRLISDCDINKHWSAMIGVFRGELRSWFCEIAGAQAMLHQHEPDYPDTGLDPSLEYSFIDVNTMRSTQGLRWWQLPMEAFRKQVRKHCHECSVPLRGYGSLAQDANGIEQVSVTHSNVFTPKKKGRAVELVTAIDQLRSKNLRVTEYLQGASK